MDVMIVVPQWNRCLEVLLHVLLKRVVLLHLIVNLSQLLHLMVNLSHSDNSIGMAFLTEDQQSLWWGLSYIYGPSYVADGLEIILLLVLIWIIYSKITL